MMTTLPLVFGRSELVEGNGFLARVRVSGHALLTEEEGQFWTEGVVPGGFAASGDTIDASLAKFCNEFALVLFDIAADAEDFEAFKGEVDGFFRDTNEAVVAEWRQAVEEVRSSGVQIDWLGRRSADTPASYQVSMVEQLSAAHNQPAEMKLAA